MTSYASNELVSSSEFAKRFGMYLSQIQHHSVEKLAILKNNRVEAVLVSKEEFEKMQEALKRVEAGEIAASIKNALDDVRSGRTYPIAELWSELDD